jgi:hypothetical protein
MPANPSETEAAVNKIALDEIIVGSPQNAGMSDKEGGKRQRQNTTRRLGVGILRCRIGIEFHDAAVKLF